MPVNRGNSAAFLGTKPLAHDLGRMVEIGDGLEQRDRGYGLRCVFPQAGFFEKDVHFEDVGDASRFRDHVGIDAAGTVAGVTLGCRVDDGQLALGLFAILRERGGEHAGPGEFPPQQRNPSRLG